MRRYATYIATEITLGIKDNLQGIKQLFFHPISTTMSIFDAIRHPLRTAKGIYHFAKGSPIRFGTNIAISILEGQAASWSWGKINTVGQPAVVEAEILTSSTCSVYANTTLPVTNDLMTASPTFLNYFINPSQGIAPLQPTSFCTPQSCMMPSSLHSTGSSVLGNANAVVASTTQSEEKRKKRTQPS